MCALWGYRYAYVVLEPVSLTFYCGVFYVPAQSLRHVSIEAWTWVMVSADQLQHDRCVQLIAEISSVCWCQQRPSVHVSVASGRVE